MASASGPIRVLHFGLGPIGLGIVRQVAARKGFKIVGAVDIDPAKVGRDLGEWPACPDRCVLRSRTTQGRRSRRRSRMSRCSAPARR